MNWLFFCLAFSPLAPIQFDIFNCTFVLMENWCGRHFGATTLAVDCDTEIGGSARSSRLWQKQRKRFQQLLRCTSATVCLTLMHSVYVLIKGGRAKLQIASQPRLILWEQPNLPCISGISKPRLGHVNLARLLSLVMNIVLSSSLIQELRGLDFSRLRDLDSKLLSNPWKQLQDISADWLCNSSLNVCIRHRRVNGSNT